MGAVLGASAGRWRVAVASLTIAVSLALVGSGARAAPAAQREAPPPAPPAADPLLDLPITDLLTVDVSIASQRSERISASPGIVSSVKMDDLRRMGVRTLKEALEHVPNVVLAEAPVGSTSISIRGLSETFNQKVLFLLDGVPYWMSSHGDIPLLGMPAEMIDRIEVIRGPGSVAYGTNASAGVVNVILKKNADQASVTVTGGSLGLLRFDANLSRKHEGGHSYFGASLQQQHEGYDAYYPSTILVPPFTPPGVKQTAAGTAPFPVAGEIIKKEEYANIVAGLEHKGLSLMLHMYEGKQNGLGGAPVIFQRNTLTYRAALLHAAYERKIGKLKLDVAADHNVFYLDLDIDNFNGGADPTTNVVTSSGGAQRYVDPLLNNFRTRLHATGRYTIEGGPQLLLGVEDEIRRAGKYIKLTGDGIELAKQSDPTTVNELSAMAQVDWTFGPLRAVAGVRFVHNSLASAHIAPRGALVYSLTDEQSIKLLYAEGYNSPVISQQDLLIPFVIEGNRELQAEVVRTIELGYSYVSPRILAVANGYLLRTDDVITRLKGPEDKQPVYQNGEGYWRYGGEVDVQVALAKRGRFLQRLTLLANASYNHQGNSERDSDPLAAFIPRFQGSLGVAYSFLDHHTLGLSQRLISPRAMVQWQDITVLAYTFNYGDVEAFFNVYNVLDRRVRDPDINSNRIPVLPGGPGVSFFGGLKYWIDR